ncbi:Y-family DNA polymerase [Sphingomonas montanisoli]|uniref:DNA polymerase Y family protein n=1 Tax=Sphingomonas montanisoli TaxID=2606412 RepID=A0A5D9C6V9_9SPHN|nr:DNA polymerase Y family protein [Sphingomonas montanisoli]TZG27419.1 DNA polymerase Y family protein [Sphingomonas montanisoli]
MTSSPSGSRRYLALWFPFLPTDRLSREGIHALATVEKVKGAMRLAAVSAEGLSIGLAPGLTLADARARIPGVAVADADPYADALWLERIADGCDRYTPMVAIDGPNGLLLDISGAAHLFGDEAGLRTDLLARLDRLGMAARAVIADTPDAAHALARHGDDIGALPVAALELGSAETLALRRAGLKRIADLSARPSAPIAARFGEEATDRLARVTGARDIRISPRRPEAALVVERRFAEPIGHTDAALAAVEALATEAASILDARHRGGRRFEARLFRTDGLVRALRIETGLPTRDVPLLMRLFRERIDALDDPIDPGFGFDLVRLAVPRAEPLAPLQLALEGGTVAEDELARLIDRLSTRLGRDRVLRHAPQDAHIPEQASFAFPAAAPRTIGPWPASESGEPALRPVTLFDPPQRIQVIAGVPDGPPQRFQWRRAAHEVVRAEGPERIGALWWRRADNGGRTRDYYRVEDTHGRRFWLFRHGLYGRETAAPDWYLHGLFA